MSRTLRTSLGLAAAATAAVGLVASGAGSALSAPHGHHAALARQESGQREEIQPRENGACDEQPRDAPVAWYRGFKEAQRSDQ